MLLFLDLLNNWNLLSARWILHNYWNLHYWNLNWQTDSNFSNTSAWIFNRVLGNYKYFVTFNYRFRRNLDKLHVRFFKHEWLKSEVFYVHKFIKFYFKFNNSGIFKNILFIHAITEEVWLFWNKYFLNLITTLGETEFHGRFVNLQCKTH